MFIMMTLSHQEVSLQLADTAEGNREAHRATETGEEPAPRPREHLETSLSGSWSPRRTAHMGREHRQLLDVW